MNKEERIKMVKAMEFITRQINNEDIFYGWWAAVGVADGDIEYGNLAVETDDFENLEYYLDDEVFADLMDTFIRCMAMAKKSGGLYCDDVVSGVKGEGT